jgi:hypothetical protein
MKLPAAKRTLQFDYDMSVLPTEQVMEKYGIGQEEMNNYISWRARGIMLPDLQPVNGSETSPVKAQTNENKDVPIGAEKPQSGYFLDDVGGHNIIVERTSREHTGRLSIPDNQAQKSDLAFVRAVGLSVEWPRVGMLVLIDRFAAADAEIRLLDEYGIERPYLLLRDVDVFCSLKKSNAEPQEGWHQVKPRG